MIRRRLGEAALVAVAAVLAAVQLTWPALRTLRTTVPGDLGDPTYFAAALSWVGHALTTDPRRLWTTPAFLGAPDNLAYTDAVLGYGPLPLLGGDGIRGAVWTLNVAIMIAVAASFVGAHVLARVMGANIAGGLVAGAAFACAPWRVQQLIHVNVISSGGMALALALVLLGHGWKLRDGWDPSRVRARWAVAGWVVACYQLTFGFALGIVFGYVVGLVGVLLVLGRLLGRASDRLRHRPRRRVPRRLVVTDVVGAAAFGLTAYLLSRPFLRVADTFPEARRTEALLPLFSPRPLGFFTAPQWSILWGDRTAGWRDSLEWPPEMVVLPGYLLLALAAVGLLVSRWPWHRRLALALAAGVAFVLGCGTAFPGGGRWTFLPLYRHVPGWDVIRTPGRLTIWLTLALCLLAAGAVSRLTEPLSRRFARAAAGTWWAPPEPVTGPSAFLASGGGTPPSAGAPVPAPVHRALLRPAAVLTAVAMLLPAAAVVVDDRAELPQIPVPVPSVPVSSLDAPVLFLPSDVVPDYLWMLWGTDGWPPLANGSSSFVPGFQQRLRTDASGFPDVASVAALRRRGVATVVVVRAAAPGTAWDGAADRPVEGLGITRADHGDVVVYDLG